MNRSKGFSKKKTKSTNTRIELLDNSCTEGATSASYFVGICITGILNHLLTCILLANKDLQKDNSIY